MAKQKWTRDQLAAAILERLQSFPEGRDITGVSRAGRQSSRGRSDLGRGITIAAGQAESAVAQQIVSELTILFDLVPSADKAPLSRTEESEMIPTPAQVKAARQLLEWSRDDVAGACGLDVAEITSFEAGRALGRETLAEMRKTLEAAGVGFDRNGSGVNLKVGE
jgi:hypothetical protein